MKKWDLLHIFLGDINPVTKGLTGMHIKAFEKLYTFKNKVENGSVVSLVCTAADCTKSTLFPVDWTIEKCLEEIVYAFQKCRVEIVEFNEYKKQFTLSVKTTCGNEVGFYYHIKNKTMKTCWFKDLP